MGLSFETISSTGANAAVIHYSPPEQGSKVIEKSKCTCATLVVSTMLLSMGINESVDLSNIAQYLDGTTDVTRTLVGQGTSTSIDAFQRS